MAILTIPTSTTLAIYRFTIELDGVVYGLSFFYNNRDERWYYDLYDESGNLLRAGLKAASGWPSLRLDKSRDRPPGDIFAIDPTSLDTEPGLSDLGDSVILTYVEEDSLG
jgi:hypothetical protein